MSGTISSTSQHFVTRAGWSALGVLFLTSVHHAYGAYIYDTPWRLHVVYLSALVAAAIAGSILVLRWRPEWILSRVAFWFFVLVTLAMPVAMIGLFEGGYNHVAKDALYFSGASPALMSRLFPPPTYELPDDVFFEVTGVLQLFAGMLTGVKVYKAIQWRNEGRSTAAVDASRATAIG